MELNPYIEALQQHLEATAGAGGEEARQLAERLAVPLESATRLALLEALAAAAGDITLELAPGSVDLILRGRDPEFAVTLPPTSPALADVGQTASSERPEPADDGGIARLTLRLPEHLKTLAEQAAARRGISVNAWLVNTVSEALSRLHTEPPVKSRRNQQSYTGWAV